MLTRKSFIAAMVLALSAPIGAFAADAPMRVACVGDSITFGSGIKDRAKDSYPAQLGKMLGDSWKSVNFGVSGTTLLNHGDRPYQKTKTFKDALAFKPDVVVIMLGTNDTKPQNWKLKDQFVADYKNLIDQFKELPSHPRIFVCLPPPVFGKGNYGINEPNLQEAIPMIKQVAQDEHAQVIDVYAALKPHPDLLRDRVHPTAQGAGIMAKTVAAALTGGAK